MAQESFILDLKPELFQFVPDLASVAKIDANNLGAVLFLQGATLPIGKCLPAGVPGFKIVSEQPKIATCPMVVRVDGDEDFIVLAFKNTGPNFYLYGLSASTLLAWKAPEKGDESEESMLRLINLSHPKLIGAVELENTETCALKDKVEELLARLPSFNRQSPKIVSCSGMDGQLVRRAQVLRQHQGHHQDGRALRPQDFGTEGRGGGRRRRQGAQRGGWC